MSFYAKLAIFWVVVYAALRGLACVPNSPVSRIATSWYGPVPSLGEFRSHFLFRWCLYALGWLAQILFVCASGWIAVWWHPLLAERILFIVVWSFALPVLGGMALLGALLAACAALKARLVGPDPTFNIPEQKLQI